MHPPPFPIVVLCSASSFKPPTFAISTEQAGKGKANPISEVKFQYGQDSGREMQNLQKKKWRNEIFCNFGQILQTLHG